MKTLRRTYTVTLSRISRDYCDVTVRADSEEKARSAALDLIAEDYVTWTDRETEDVEVLSTCIRNGKSEAK